jgi:Na+-translocating ferredoxin:NAD+ oxidoreductase subunit B
MMEEIYEKLRERLDGMGTGFPKTENRVEMRILKKLFNEEEAGLFLYLAPLLERPDQVAQRLGRDPQETAELMERMAAKGLIFRQRKGEVVRYAAVPFVVGIFEFQLNRLDRELIRDLEEYFEKAFGKTIQGFNTPVLRTIPINRGLVADWPVAPYEDAMAILDGKDIIAVAPCICRTMAHMDERGCDKPVEACFSFGSHAHYYVENHMGRYVTKEEAKAIMRRNEEAGLVVQPFNSQNVGGMCSCCGDCCGVLKSLKKQPSPAKSVQSNYFVQVNAEDCVGCETCLDRCQMEAITMVEDRAVINLDRCIGCGLCVTTCATEALKLIKKPEEVNYKPPESGSETYIRLAMERGKNPLPEGMGI